MRRGGNSRSRRSGTSVGVIERLPQGYQTFWRAGVAISGGQRHASLSRRPPPCADLLLTNDHALERKANAGAARKRGPHRQRTTSSSRIASRGQRAERIVVMDRCGSSGRHDTQLSGAVSIPAWRGCNSPPRRGVIPGFDASTPADSDLPFELPGALGERTRNRTRR